MELKHNYPISACKYCGKYPKVEIKHEADTSKMTVSCKPCDISTQHEFKKSSNKNNELEIAISDWNSKHGK